MNEQQRQRRQRKTDPVTSLPQTRASSCSSSSRASAPPAAGGGLRVTRGVSQPLDTDSAGGCPSPEVMFLVRQQAKTLSAINSICKRLDTLEAKVCDIQKNVSEAKSSPTPASGPSATGQAAISQTKSSAVANVLSDDSGGEFSSRVTGTTDDDELLSLLDQIAKCSQQIRETQQAQTYQQSFLISSLSRDRERDRDRDRDRERDNHHIYEPLSMLGTRPSGAPSAGATLSPLHRHSSLRTLLFDDNVDRFLGNIQHLIDEDKPQLMPSQSPAYSQFNSVNNAIRPQPGATPAHSLRSPDAGSSAASSALPVGSETWRMGRVRQLVRQREQEEVESQYDLADQWLANHVKDRRHRQDLHQQNQHQHQPQSQSQHQHQHRHQNQPQPHLQQSVNNPMQYLGSNYADVFRSKGLPMTPRMEMQSKR